MSQTLKTIRYRNLACLITRIPIDFCKLTLEGILSQFFYLHVGGKPGVPVEMKLDKFVQRHCRCQVFSIRCALAELILGEF